MLAAPESTVQPQLFQTACARHFAITSLRAAIFTQARGGALPLVVQQKACDWCKYFLLLPHSDYIGKQLGSLSESFRRHPPMLPLGVATLGTIKGFSGWM
jgi:hypothetical protein